MSGDHTKGYSEYVANSAYFRRYHQHQSGYRRQPRFSDTGLIELASSMIPPTGGAILDVGCSTGNLLYHMRNAFADRQVRFVGAELAEES